MRLLVTGGRYFGDVQTLRRILGTLNPTAICQGGATGADMHAKHWADDNGVPQVEYPAEWQIYGKGAGPIRNEQMLADFNPDAVLAFPGNVGTKHMITIAERDGVPTYETCFVFGSNLAGRHGKGAALNAKEHWQAKYGVGVGPTGWAYAIPTKDETVYRRLGLADIHHYVAQFIDYADSHPRTIFFVSAIGCGLAGYTAADVGPFFELAPINCILPLEFGARGWNGRHGGLKIHCPEGRAGSTPAERTNEQT